MENQKKRKKPEPEPDEEPMGHYGNMSAFMRAHLAELFTRDDLDSTAKAALFEEVVYLIDAAQHCHDNGFISTETEKEKLWSKLETMHKKIKEGEVVAAKAALSLFNKM